MLRYFAFLAVTLALFATLDAEGRVKAAEPYDFHKSEAYAKLTKEQQEKLAIADRRLKRVQEALHKYAKDHSGKAATTLEQLVPDYLDKLPRDPFATKVSAADTAENIKPLKRSTDGYGFRYRPGRGTSWWLYSAGLKDFPFHYASKNNAGIGYIEGYWYGPVQFILDVY